MMTYILKHYKTLTEFCETRGKEVFIYSAKKKALIKDDPVFKKHGKSKNYNVPEISHISYLRGDTHCENRSPMAINIFVRTFALKHNEIFTFFPDAIIYVKKEDYYTYYKNSPLVVLTPVLS